MNCNNFECGNCGVHDSSFITNTNNGTATGDSRKYRIGNDINLDITINELNGMDIINIKSIRCFIKNTTPGMDPHNHYDVHRIGLPMYHAMPQNRNYGYGMYPGVPNFHRLYPNYPYLRDFNPHWHMPVERRPHLHPHEFDAPVKALEDRNKVRVYFPAIAQMLCGMYSLTFVIQLYEPGYHCNNLRTVTVDYNNVFELVPNMEGASGSIVIDLDKEIGFNNFTPTVTNGASGNVISILNIIGDTDIRVGTSETYTAQQDPNTGNIRWSINNNCAIIGNSTNFTTQLFGSKIDNVQLGYDEVTLRCDSTDGGGAFDEKVIRVHNYCTDVKLEGYENKIYLQPGQSIETRMFAEQEDGTRLAKCESKGICQTVPAVNMEMMSMEDGCVLIEIGKKENTECEWQYDDQDGNLNSPDSSTICESCKCCDDCVSRVIFTNVNRSEYQKIAKIKLVSNLRGADGNPVERIYEIICVGKTGGSSEEPENPDDNNDTYVTGGQMNRTTNSLELNRNDGATISISYPQSGIINYWYDSQS